MPNIGPKGSGVGVGVGVGSIVGVGVGVITTVGVFAGWAAVGVPRPAVAMRYTTAAMSELHTSATRAIIRTLPFLLFHRVISFSLPIEVIIGLSIAEWSIRGGHIQIYWLLIPGLP